MRKLQQLNCLGVAFMLWAGFLGALAPAQAESASGLFAILASENGLALLSDTVIGRSLAERLIGRAVTGTSDMAAIKTRLEAQDARTLCQELESPLTRIDTELRASQRLRPLSAIERTRLLDQLSERYLQLRFLSLPVAAAESSLARASVDFVGSFSSIFPVEVGSLEARLPAQLKIADRLATFEKKFFDEQGLAHPDKIADQIRKTTGSSQVRLTQVIEGIIERRQVMARELHTMADLYRQSEPFLADTLAKAAGQIHVSPNSVAKFKLNTSNLDQITYINGRDFSEIGGFVGKLFGEMGELKVAVRVAGVMERGLSVGQLGTYFGQGAVGDAARAELHNLAEQYPDYMQKELDLIMDQGTEWGEVKNYMSEFSPQHHHYERVMEQAQKTVQIKNLLESNPQISAALKAMGKTIRLRIYFVSGVTDDAAKQLEAMGIRVFGQRFAVNP